MSNINNIGTGAERIESFKAAILASFCTIFAFMITSEANNFVLAKFLIFNVKAINIFDSYWWVSAGGALFSGFLFGVTYRYIIRTDDNPQLKAGGVMAFGLVRGLAQVDMKFADFNNININNVLPLAILLAGSIFMFGSAGLLLDIAMRAGWIKPFTSN